MKRLIIGLLVFSACTSVPITGRKQVNLMNEGELTQMSIANYKEVLETSNIVGDYDEQARMVKEVGNKIAVACEEFLKEQGQEKRVEGFEWEFNLIDEATVNAWCMPGGKVAFYTGIMPVCQDANGVAVVMGHEIAHAVARHGNERMSQQTLVQLGGATLAVASSTQPALTRDLYMMSYGVGSNLGVLAYSRSHESEADKMGLVFMEYAGYDSEVAVEFWTRMSQLGGEKPPELMSTHPSDEKRINDIKAFIPAAKGYAAKRK
jgi:predicted Zn-dependent protease